MEFLCPLMCFGFVAVVFVPIIYQMVVGIQSAIDANRADRPTFEAESHFSQDEEDERYERANYADPIHGEATQLYLVEMTQGSHKFLKIGISNNSVRRRFGRDIEERRLDFVERVCSVVFTERKDALLAEKRLLEATRKYHYEPGRSFGGSERECRSLSIKEWLIKAMRAIGADAYKNGRIFDGNFMR